MTLLVASDELWLVWNRSEVVGLREANGIIRLEQSYRVTTTLPGDHAGRQHTHICPHHDINNESKNETKQMEFVVVKLCLNSEKKK